MDWTLEDNTSDGLFFCATLISGKGGHLPFTHASAGASDTGAEAVEPDPRWSWKRHSGSVGAGAGDESEEYCRVVQPHRTPSVIRPVRRTYVIVVR